MMQSALLSVRPQTLLWTFKVFFFFSLLKLPLWWMLYSCTSGVGTMPSWCVCWSELSGERLCWLSTISQSVFMCVRWSISLLTLVSQAPRSTHQVLANIWHVVMVSSLLLWQWLFVSFSLQDWKLTVFSFLSLHTHTACICVFGSSLSCKCRSDGNSYFYLTIMLKWFSVYMFPSCVIMNVMWM